MVIIADIYNDMRGLKIQRNIGIYLFTSISLTYYDLQIIVSPLWLLYSCSQNHFKGAQAITVRALSPVTLARAVEA